MALESGELAADLIAGYLSSSRTPPHLRQLNLDYQTAYHCKFDSRLKACAWMRRAAFVPGMADAAIRLFRSDRLRQFMSRATRGRYRETYSLVKRVDNCG